MGLDECVEAAEICEWRVVMDVLIRAVLTLVTDAALMEMIEAWTSIVGGEYREVIRSVSVGVV